jgi:uncharacterized protein (DUF488 family)
VTAMRDHAEPSMELVLYTLGHSNHTLGRFLNLLGSFRIRCVADVRSVPFSRFSPHFDRDSLAAALLGQDIDYLWLGDELGGRRGGDLQTSFGRRRDDRYEQDGDYLRGVLRLVEQGHKCPTAMMCSEEDPRRCHRHKIIAQTLLRDGTPGLAHHRPIRVLHLRADGSLEDARSIPVAFQPSLFE